MFNTPRGKDLRGVTHGWNPNNGDDVTDFQTIIAKKPELLETFFQRYDWRLPLDLTPRDPTFQLVSRVCKRRSGEFTPLSSSITSAAESRDVQIDPVRIKGANGELILGPSKS